MLHAEFPTLVEGIHDNFLHREHRRLKHFPGDDLVWIVGNQRREKVNR